MWRGLIIIGGSSLTNITISNRFVEDSFGQVVRNTIKVRGWEAHKQYGLYLLYDLPGSSVLCHSDGRRYLTAEQKKIFRQPAH